MGQSFASMVALVTVWFATLSHAATPAQIDKSLATAKKWLYEQQKNDTWELGDKPQPYTTTSDLPTRQSAAAGQWGGRTSLAVYALLASGENPQDPRLVKPIAFLKSAKVAGAYALGLRCQVWLHLPQTADVKAAMKKDAEALMGMVKTTGPARGHYDYLDTKQSLDYSHSRSQYGVLGVWAAQQSGVEIPRSYWEIVEEGWIEHQFPDGGWSYKAPSNTGGYPESPGMTAAAVATLFITQDMLHSNRGINCQGNVENPAIEKGLAWLAKNSDKIGAAKRYPRDFPYATLYAFERVGIAAGYKYIGDVDWFAKGADWLVKTQLKDGSWTFKPTDGASADQWFPGLTDASFSILFLARGKAPVVMNKLQYYLEEGKPGNWNQRPRDVANLVRYLAHQTERNFNWQIVNLKVAGDADLHDAPILYISGNQPLKLADKEQARLKKFVEEGGMILANADCGNSAFTRAFEAMCAGMFEPYEFRNLPVDHPIFNQQFTATKWKNKPQIRGLSNGARELALLLPETDPAKAWQLGQTARAEVFQLGVNIYQYATDKLTQPGKGVTFIVAPSEKIIADAAINVARLQYNGNWNPEPGGWRRLAAIMHNRHKTDLKIQTVKLGRGKLDDIKLAHLTGTTPFKFDDAAKTQLKQFIEYGGTLLIDAAGGSSEFAAAMETELAAMFPDDAVQLQQPLPPDHAIYNADKPLPAMRYRLFAQKVTGQLSTPRLRGIKSGERVAVIYSPDDLSVALVGQPVDGIIGYDPASAIELMTRILTNVSK